MWLSLGTIVTHLMASGGPFAYEALTGSSVFSDLFIHLRAVDMKYDLVALDLQAHVWNNVTTGNYERWKGMSAMPSLHVAAAVLFPLVLGRIHAGLGAVGWAIVVLILLGSVYLGWHYAIDGYVGIVGTLGVWSIAGRLTRRKETLGVEQGSMVRDRRKAG
jgi:membrane-associated phospholipid phosphatase